MTLALGGGPAAFSLQLLVGSTLTAYACFPGPEPLAAPAISHLRLLLLLLYGISLLIATSGGVAAWYCWRATRAEMPGSAHMLLSHGDGRTRFMAMSAMMISVLFLLAVFSMGLNLVWLPTCL